MYLPAAYDNSVIMDSDSYISGLGVDKNRVTATKKATEFFTIHSGCVDLMLVVALSYAFPDVIRSRVDP